MYYSMYIYTHTAGYCEKPGEADTQSTMSLLYPCTAPWSVTNLVVQDQNQ